MTLEDMNICLLRMISLQQFSDINNSSFFTLFSFVFMYQALDDGSEVILEINDSASGFDDKHADDDCQVCAIFPKIRR